MKMTTGEAALQSQLRRISLLFLLSALLFFPMIMNPVTFGVFDETKTDAESLAFIEDHWLAIRLLFTGMGVAELGLGLAFWSWGRSTSAMWSGRNATAAVVAGGLGLAGGVVNLITRWFVWTKDAQGFFDFGEDIPAWGLAVQLAGWLMFSGAMLVFGAQMVRGPMPNWLGIVFGLCGLLVYPTGMLPLWFYLGAIVLGIAGLRRYRSGGPLSDVAAQPAQVTV